MTDRTRVFNCDCLPAMRETPDKFYHLAIVDPPYGIDINMNMGRQGGKAKVHEDKSWDSAAPQKVYFDELQRVSKFQIIWGGNYFPLPLTGSWLFWDKMVPDGVSFASGELAWTSGDKHSEWLKFRTAALMGPRGRYIRHRNQSNYTNGS